MANSTEFGRRIDEFVRGLAEEFEELPESAEPLMTRIEDWPIKIGNAVMTRAVEPERARGTVPRAFFPAVDPIW